MRTLPSILIATTGVAVQAAFVDGGSYMPTGVGLLLFGLGAGIAMPAATEMIMATLPPARAGRCCPARCGLHGGGPSVGRGEGHG